MVVERRLCCGEAFKADSLDKCSSVLRAVPFLFRQVPHSVTLKSEPASLSPARSGGGSPGCAANSDQLESRVRSGCLRNGIDGPDVDRRPSVGRQLVPGLAGVVHRFYGTPCWGEAERR